MKAMPVIQAGRLRPESRKSTLEDTLRRAISPIPRTRAK